MKTGKKILVVVLVLALMAALASCGDKDKEPVEFTRPPEAHPDAEIESHVNADGDLEFSYTNPDGSGGGGATLS